jgi:ABC-2 type transport system ATP-binding protein
MNERLALDVRNLTKSFSVPEDFHYTLKQKIAGVFSRNNRRTFKVLDNISFQVEKGDFFGIVGRNGSGKSTILKILAGIYTTDQGQISINGDISPFLELGVGFSPDLTGRDNVFLNGVILGLTRKEVAKNFDEIVAFSELEGFIDQKLRNYSSGMIVKLAFSVAIFANKDILLMDEVLAVGDVYFKEKCLNALNRLRQTGKTIIFISHDTETIRRQCNKAILIRRAKIEAYGDPENVLKTYTAQKK